MTAAAGHRFGFWTPESPEAPCLQLPLPWRKTGQRLCGGVGGAGMIPFRHVCRGQLLGFGPLSKFGVPGLFKVPNSSILTPPFLISFRKSPPPPPLKSPMMESCYVSQAGLPT